LFVLGEIIGGVGGRTQQQTCVEKHLTAANCLYIYLVSGALEAKPPDPHWRSAPGPSPGPLCPPDFKAWLRHCLGLGLGLGLKAKIFGFGLVPCGLWPC